MTQRSSPNLQSERAGPPIGLCVIVLGAIGFAAGFFGPMLLQPDANQGPMLGIFITGPGGAAFGLVLGCLLRILPLSNALRWRVLKFSAAALGVGTLFFCLPEPQTQGLLVRGEVAECRPAAELAPAALKSWEQRVDQMTWMTARAGWREDVARMLRVTPGVVLRLNVQRQNVIRKHRKPWNDGRIDARGWRAERYSYEYFADFAGSSCDDYVGELPVLYMQVGQFSGAWPPEDLWNFLNLPRIESPPARYAAFVRE